MEFLGFVKLKNKKSYFLFMKCRSCSSPAPGWCLTRVNPGQVNLTRTWSGRSELTALCSGGAAAGAGGDAVFGENGLELLQRGVCSDPRRVKVGPTHPETGLRQVLQELIQPEERGQGSQMVPGLETVPYSHG